jgi:putative protease
MNQIELLAPAGDEESLKVAIQKGANAVYLSGARFGARSFAPNFTKDQMQSAVFYAHERNVKIYVTVNTILFEEEL